MLETIFSIAKTVFSVLFDIGTWFQENPVLALTLMVIAFIAIFVLRKFFGLFKIILFAILLLFIVIGLQKLFPSDIDDIDQPDPTGWFESSVEWVQSIFSKDDEQVDWFEAIFDKEERARLMALEKVMHTPLRGDEEGGLVKVGYGRLTDAPDLSGKNYDEGLKVLSEVADEYSGEVGYVYVTDKNGKKFWSEGIISSGLELRLGELIVRYKDATSLVSVHTHPSLAGYNTPIPPSIPDINLASLAYMELGEKVTHVVVQADRVWNYDVSRYVANLKGLTEQEIIDKYGTKLAPIVTTHQPIYTCEGVCILDEPKEQQNMCFSQCKSVSKSARERAVQKVLSIYKDIGVKINSSMFKRSPYISV